MLECVVRSWMKSQTCFWFVHHTVILFTEAGGDGRETALAAVLPGVLYLNLYNGHAGHGCCYEAGSAACNRQRYILPRSTLPRRRGDQFGRKRRAGSTTMCCGLAHCVHCAIGPGVDHHARKASGEHVAADSRVARPSPAGRTEARPMSYMCSLPVRPMWFLLLSVHLFRQLGNGSAPMRYEPM